MVDFLDLPYIPKCLVFRYVDTATLNQVRLTSSAVNLFVKSNRHRLSKPEIASVRIMENINIDDTIMTQEYCVEIVKCRLQWMAAKNSLDPFNNARKIVVRSTDMSSFLYWLTSSHTELDLLEFRRCCFKSNWVNDTPPPWKKSKFRTNRVKITNVTFSEQDPDAISRFLAYLMPAELYVFGCKQNELGKFLSPYFYQMVFPSLKDLVMFPGTLSRLPYREEKMLSDVDRFPTRLRYTYAHIIPFEAVRRAILTWWKGESEIVCWTIQIPSEHYLDINLLATLLDFPYRLGWQQQDLLRGEHRRRRIELFRPIDEQRLIIVPPSDTYSKACRISTVDN